LCSRLTCVILAIASLLSEIIRTVASIVAVSGSIRYFGKNSEYNTWPFQFLQTDNLIYNLFSSIVLVLNPQLCIAADQNVIY